MRRITLTLLLALAAGCGEPPASNAGPPGRGAAAKPRLSHTYYYIPG